MFKYIVLALCLSTVYCQTSIAKTNNCRSAGTLGCASCWGDAVLDYTTVTDIKCSTGGVTRCLILETGSTTSCQVCQATYRKNTTVAATSTCDSTTCTTTGVKYCTWDGTNELPIACDTGYWQADTGNTCTNTGGTNHQVTNCMYAYIPANGSGVTADGKCLQCNAGYVLNAENTACDQSSDTQLQNTCRQFATGNLVCAACLYGQGQVSSDNTYCTAKIVALGLAVLLSLVLQ